MFIKGVRMMFGFSHTAILMTSFQHFKVPVFREILPPSEQNIQNVELIYLGLSIFRQSSNLNHTL